MKNTSTAIVYGNGGILLVLTVYFLLLPGFIVVRHLRDPAMSSSEIPRMAWSVFRSITPRYERWAKERVASGTAAGLSTTNISGTEWPLFGSVFYLWAVESLQEAWERDSSSFPVAPAQYARGAVDAATALVTDPNHATWVKEHWGDDYLHDEDVFYRVLLIAALTSQYKLTGETSDLHLLTNQVATLSRDIDESRHGVLDDYPGQCYPMDVLTAVAAIRQADAVLGTDHTDFVARARRGFQGALVDKRGLPPYSGNADTGVAHEPSRGCGISYGLVSAPTLWPDVARAWYAGYEEYFWQRRHGLAGFREFPSDLDGGNFYWDVDAGPVIDGVGVAASAFGVAASRINGRFDHAYPLAAQMLVFSWPLPHGPLLTARVLSNAADAPLLGEACILFNLTRLAHPGVDIVGGGRIPGIVYVALPLYFLLGLVFAGSAIRSFGRCRRRTEIAIVPGERFQLLVWAGCVVSAMILLTAHRTSWAVATLLLAQLLPRTRAP